MNFQEIISSIQNELRNPLPGPEVQMQMTSMKRVRELMNTKDTVHWNKSSVLILLYPAESQKNISIILIQRPDYEGVHGGQISLPGGRWEEGDADLSFTAIREAREEIGIDATKISLIGSLSELYIPPSSYIVYPFVGFSRERPHFMIDPHEVDSIIEIKLRDLINDDLVVRKNIFVRDGFSVFGPCFEINSHIIWGATAMILNEFKEILKRSVPASTLNSL
jgi:8-oxo-dGTP pyrophosphatase MutT (NUDIX family)